MKSPWPAGERPKSACVCGGATGDVVKHSWKSWGLHITLQHLIKDVSQGTRRSRCLLHWVNIELVSLVVTHEFLLIHMEATSWSALSLRQIFVSHATLHLNGPTHTHTHTRAAVLQPGLCSTRIRSIQLPIIIDQSVVKWGGGEAPDLCRDNTIIAQWPPHVDRVQDSLIAFHADSEEEEEGLIPAVQTHPNGIRHD